MTPRAADERAREADVVLDRADRLHEGQAARVEGARLQGDVPRGGPHRQARRRTRTARRSASAGSHYGTRYACTLRAKSSAGLGKIARISIPASRRLASCAVLL